MCSSIIESASAWRAILSECVVQPTVIVILLVLLVAIPAVAVAAVALVVFLVVVMKTRSLDEVLECC